MVRSLSGVDRHEELTLRPYDGGEPKGTVELSVDLAVGQVEIVRLLDSGARTDGAPPAPPSSGAGGPVMNRHRFEPARLLLGLLLAGAALTYVMDALGQWQVPWWVLLPMLPVALFMAAFTAWVTFLVRRRLRRRPGSSPEGPQEGMPVDDLRRGYQRSGEGDPGRPGEPER